MGDMFKDRLLTLLREKKMSQTAFAERVGVPQVTVSNWVRGGEPKMTTYERVIAVFPELRVTADEQQRAV